MSEAQRIDVTEGALAAGLLTLCAGAAFFLLSWAATPGHFSRRMTEAETHIAAAETMLEMSRRPLAFPRGSVCADAAERGAGAIKTRVAVLAAQSGVTLASLAASPIVAMEGATIVPVGLQFEATGRYDQVVSLLQGLARQTPTVFVDSADLTSQVSSVDFKFSGRIYCSVRP